ncbi:MAG TPA: Maf family protein [Kiritimatiellia bacterium]|nr:Maf family protein [Kiritimatiellia bacterium]HMP00340.1 Maf family protein [Kiritimatiellia bacterium]HMP97211.1 Maf family protein [Kiritimatiellia bacterium]
MSQVPHQKLPLILASASPRRRELLAGLEMPFTVSSPDIDETPWPGELPASFALRMAQEKAAAVLRGRDAGEPVTVIAADTIVVLGSHILGKPTSPHDAVATLRLLSGRTHVVMTGLCIWRRDAAGQRLIGDAVSTRVTFRVLRDEEIHHYVASGEPMDKAGSYAIQGGAAGMVDHIDGSYSNVVGLPMEAVTRWLDILG